MIVLDYDTLTLEWWHTTIIECLLDTRRILKSYLEPIYHKLTLSRRRLYSTPKQAYSTCITIRSVNIRRHSLGYVDLIWIRIYHLAIFANSYRRTIRNELGLTLYGWPSSSVNYSILQPVSETEMQWLPRPRFLSYYTECKTSV